MALKAHIARNSTEFERLTGLRRRGAAESSGSTGTYAVNIHGRVGGIRRKFTSFGAPSSCSRATTNAHTETRATSHRFPSTTRPAASHAHQPTTLPVHECPGCGDIDVFGVIHHLYDGGVARVAGVMCFDCNLNVEGYLEALKNEARVKGERLGARGHSPSRLFAHTVTATLTPSHTLLHQLTATARGR